MTYKSAVQANGFRYGALDFTLSAVSTTRPTIFEISPTADFAPSTVRPCLRASSVTASSTSAATSVARAVCSVAESAEPSPEPRSTRRRPAFGHAGPAACPHAIVGTDARPAQGHRYWVPISPAIADPNSP